MAVALLAERFEPLLPLQGLQGELPTRHEAGAPHGHLPAESGGKEGARGTRWDQGGGVQEQAELDVQREG